MVSGGMTLVKYLLFIFNLLFVISGIAIVVVGVLALQSYKKHSAFVDETFAAGHIILIVAGAIIFVIAFFGCCGAIRENNCMVMTYSVLLSIIFCIQLAAGICGYMYRNDVKKDAENVLRKTVKNYATDPDIHRAWDILQEDFKCCGADGPGDWVKEGLMIPKSCCASGIEVCVMSDSFWQGCSSVLNEMIEHFALIICGIVIGIAFVELLGIILGCCLGRAIRKESAYGLA